MSLPRAYLAMKLTQPLPIRGGAVLRTVGEAANYVLELPQSQVEGCQRWRQAAQLLLDQAGVAEVSKQVKLALFYDAPTSRPWSRERSRVGRPSRRGRGRAFHPLHRLWRLDELPRSRPSVRARRAVVAPGAGSTAMTGAQFEIRIDGSACSYRDRKDYAMEAARLIKSKYLHSMVEVKDLLIGTSNAPHYDAEGSPRGSKLARQDVSPNSPVAGAASRRSRRPAYRPSVSETGESYRLVRQSCAAKCVADGCAADFTDAERRDCGGNRHPDDRSRDAARHIESPDKFAVTPAVPSRPGCSPRQLNRRSRSCWCGHIRGLPGSTGRQRPERSRTRRRPEQGPEQSWSS